MNVLFLTQSGSLEMFYHLMSEMKELTTLDKIGFYVTDSRYYNNFKVRFPGIESDNISVVKEWEIVRDSMLVKADKALLEKYEKELGQPNLWNALVTDRRIYFGKRYAYDQDYRSRYDHERMLAILEVGLKRMEKLFDDVKPDLVVSFICVTIGEYLSYLFAGSRETAFLNLRPTRIKNYFYAGESVLEPSDHLEDVYNTFLDSGVESDLKDKAAQYLREAQEKHAMYEGVLPASSRPPGVSESGKEVMKLFRIKKAVNLIVGEYKSRYGEYRYDHYISGYFGPLLWKRIIRPWRIKRTDKKLAEIYVSSKDLPALNYAFFPLHTEPEVTLNVYSKPYLNQIEAVRLVSHNLPVGMKLIVKEHPWAVGKRKLSYYRKLLEIPNVILARPGMPSRELILNAGLVTVIAGSIGFEAAMLKKPVIVLGRAPFNFLPSTMVCHADNPDRLGINIRDLMDNYRYDENALICYISAVMSESVPVDFYSRLLGRPGVYVPGKPSGVWEESDRTYKEQIGLLAKYLLRSYRDNKERSKVAV